MSKETKASTVPNRNKLTDLALQECRAWWKSEGITIGLSTDEVGELDGLIKIYESI